MKGKATLTVLKTTLVLALAAAAVLLIAQGTTRGEGTKAPVSKKLKFKYSRTKVLDKGNFKVRWSLKEDVLRVALESSYSRYMAVGINTEPRMKGADMIIARIDKGRVVSVQDHFGNEKQKHKPDKQLGGSSRIKKFYDRSDGDWMAVEILLKAQSDDPNDVSVLPGRSYYFLAAGTSLPEWLAKHSFYDKFKVSF